MRDEGWLLFGMLTAAGCGPAISTSSGGDGGGTATSAATGGPRTSTTDPPTPPTTDGASSNPAGTSDGGAEMLEDPCSCATLPAASACAGQPGVICDADELCPPLVTTCTRPQDFYGCTFQEVVVDEAVLSCVLTALIERAPGRIRLVEETGGCGFEGCSERESELFVSPDASFAVEQWCEVDPLFNSVASSRLRELAAPEFFENCTQRDTQAMRFACLIGGLSGEGDSVCVED